MHSNCRATRGSGPVSQSSATLPEVALAHAAGSISVFSFTAAAIRCVQPRSIRSAGEINAFSTLSLSVLTRNVREMARPARPRPFARVQPYTVVRTCENRLVKFQVLSAVFLALLTTGSAQVPDTQAAEQAGAVLFRGNCARCHGANLEGTKKAPAIAEIRKKKHWTDERITDRVLNGAGKKMPPFRESLSDEQIQQLIAYLRAENRPTPPPAAEQK
jgi:mono/diheme cytochrome c family protein